jgi:hypothetical protein
VGSVRLLLELEQMELRCGRAQRKTQRHHPSLEREDAMIGYQFRRIRDLTCAQLIFRR